jgi:hypothetical protein
MTVKELKEELEKYPDDYTVLIPRADYYYETSHGLISFPYAPLDNVGEGVNELEFTVLLDERYEGED